MRAILLDRDGVINRERPDYVKHWGEFEFLPGALQALRRLATLDWPILVVTNQSAIGRGLATPHAVAEVHRRMTAAVVAAGGRIDAVFVCPHHPDQDCNCRKPRPGLLLQAASQFNLDLSQSYLIGDAVSDVQAGLTAGCRPILVLTGREREQLPLLEAGDCSDYSLAANLTEAVALILEEQI